jgi:hypothetical protein
LPALGPWEPLDEQGQRPSDEGSSHRIELIGSQLLASAEIDVPGTQRLSDYFGLLQGFCRVRDLVVLTHRGRSGRIRLREARIRLDDIAVVGESRHCPCTEGSRPETPRAMVIPKEPHRVVVITTDHMIYGVAHLPQNGSLAAFIDAEHPPFVSMTNVRVRWLADRRLAGRYNFALVQRSHIIGIELRPGGDAAVESFQIPGAAFPADQSLS